MADIEQPTAEGADDASELPVPQAAISASERTQRALAAEKSLRMFCVVVLVAVASFCLTLGVFQRAAPVVLIAGLVLFLARRRLVRFGIRGLLVVTLLAALPLAWYGAEYRQYWHEQRVIDSFAQKGFANLYRGKPRLSAVFCDMLTPAAEDTFRRVEGGSLQGPDVRDEDLARLRGLPALRKLTIKDTGVGATGLSLLADSPVEELTLGGQSIDAAALQAVCQWRNLRRLNLIAVPLTADVLRDLPQLKQLEELGLGIVKPLDDETLRAIAQCPALKQLSLSMLGTRVQHLEQPFTPAGLAELRQLPRLEELRLNTVLVSDELLAELARFKLQSLELGNVTLTEQQLDLLQQADEVETTTLRYVRAPLKAAHALPKKLRTGRKVVLHGLQPPWPK